VLSPIQLAQLTTPASGELFEGFGKEFAELRGHCILVPAAHNYNNLNKTDDIIKQLHPVLSPECAGRSTFETMLAALFAIKEKWTLPELDTFLKGTVEPE